MTAAGQYLQFGCGFAVGEGWLNFDNSPTLRLQRLPLGAIAARLAGGVRFPDAVQYGDIVAGPLAPAGSCAGLFASHVLEHLSLADFETALQHAFIMLQPGGIFRIVVPDLDARARRYVAMLDAGSDQAADFFMRSTHLGHKERPRGLIGTLRAAIGNSAHLWMWDERAMVRKLAEAGFVDMRRCSFGDCEDPAFAAVEHESRFVEEGSGIIELAIECRKPR